ncbi:MAG: T9SS type A sorting domain-containing protein [Candidatus Kapabacteria bacterium]|nr:T9SS type A sorting domain-containing protein [Candidatus Kapabacteria bacterium]
MKQKGTIVALLFIVSAHAGWSPLPCSDATKFAPNLTPLQTERRAIADSLPRENRIQSIREANGEYIIVVELISDQRRLDIGVYNLLGKRVVTIYQGRAAAGIREYPIPTASLPNGIYICVVQGDGFRLAQKFVLSR